MVFNILADLYGRVSVPVHVEVMGYLRRRLWKAIFTERADPAESDFKIKAIDLFA